MDANRFYQGLMLFGMAQVVWAWAVLSPIIYQITVN